MGGRNSFEKSRQEIEPPVSEEDDEERVYGASRERSLARLREGFDLGTGGRAASWTREELHDRGGRPPVLTDA